MKKAIFIFIMLSCLANTLKAQIYVWNDQSISYGNSAECVDSIVFLNGMEFWKNSTPVYKCNNTEVDSITFIQGELQASLADFEVSFDDNEKNIYGLSAAETIPVDTDDPYFEDYVENMDFDKQVTVVYDGSSVETENSTDGVTITADGANVVVNSTAENVKYVLKGSSSNGSFKIYSDKRIAVILDNLNLTNQSGAVLNVQSTEPAYIVIQDDTENLLGDSETYSIPENEKMNSCIYSLGRMILSGKGKLTVNALYKHGISNDEDYIKVRNGCQISITSVNDGIHAADDFVVDSGCLEIDSEGDGIQADKGNIYVNGGFLKISTNGEKSHGLKTDADFFIWDGAIQCSVYGLASKGLSCDGNINIENGRLTLMSYADPLYEDNDLTSSAGIKCDGDFNMDGGSINISSSGNGGKGINVDGKIVMNSGLVRVETTGKQYVYGSLDTSAKGVKAEKNIVINGGTMLVRAIGGDGSEGIESKDSIIVNNGTIVSKCYDDAMNASNNITVNGGYMYIYSNGNDGMDSNGTVNINGGITLASGTREPESGIDCDQSLFSITGGILIGVGGTTSSPTASASTQNTIIYNGARNVSEYVEIRNEEGESLLAFKLPQEYGNSVTLLFSFPDIELDQKYDIYTFENITGGTGIFGIYCDSSNTGGTLMTSVTAKERVTTTGSSTGPGGGGPGGRPGGNW